MGNPKKTAPRMTRDSWLQAALKILANDGINAVTVDAIAVKFGITRGSFYHHFRDRKELSHEMLEFWLRRWTTELLDDITLLGLDGYQSLLALIRLFRHREAAAYYLAVRSWASHDAMAKEVVKKADETRLNFIRSHFQTLGFEGLDLENRSRLFLYYEMSEFAFFAPPDDDTEQQLDEIRLNFLTAKPENPT